MDRRWISGAAAFLFAVALVAATGVASADPHGRAKGHDGARGTAAHEQGTTEDNDGDGFPNTPDPSGDGDNRHPSGEDRSDEAGRSGNQGASTSTPDQDGHGPERDEDGTDKPDGPGGADILDQDMNNGCGNDDDFDDDNEGWCGKPAEVVPPTVVAGETPPVEVGAQRDEAEVLGARITRGDRVEVAGVLATTAAAIGGFALAGFALASAGVMLRGRRRQA